MMRKRFFSFSAVLSFIFLLLVTGCQREVDTPGGGGPAPVDIDKIMVVAGIRGTVIDENNQPVIGASVVSGTSTTTTDNYGVFHFNNINLSKANGAVKVTKPGYFTGTRSFVTTAGRIHNVRIRLLPKSNTGTFTGSAGGTITLSSGGKLVIPASAVTDASGNVYAGPVNVAMVWIDPTAPTLPEVVPGDLRGITTNGQERGLETYGMLGVEMTGPGGQSLKIASGKTAELTFPVPSALSGTAPATIDLWHFDEATARWKQEGTAAKTGSNYIAQVSHFSFWNCDVPFPLINLCMTLVNAANAQPLNNVQVRIKRTNGSYGFGWTDSVGKLCANVPQNEALVLQVIDQCNNVAYSQNIGPYSSNSDAGTIPITISAANSLIITGTLLNCSGANVTNGAVTIYTPGSYSYSVLVSNGTFSFTVLHCSTNINFSIEGIDYATTQVSAPVIRSGTTGTVNIGSIQACGTTPEYVELIINGTPYFTYVEFPPNPSFIDANDSAQAGNYSTKTKIDAQNGMGANNMPFHTSFGFSNNKTTGVYPMDTSNNYSFFSIHISLGPTNVNTNLSQILTVNPTVNITSFGPIGGYIEGNFNIMATTIPATIPYNVICNFKVKR
ncbi:MAG: carboxypeptidase regulatory-like domain-containing protein [Ferruginibacter sp.]|nr:carboxypeptidase regulatory-like domain-containing protein [Chitinophagaceae bacterium]